MRATTSPARPAAAAVSSAANPWSWMADLGRQQFALATEGASALFRGSEAMRRIQLQAAHQACARHEAVAQKLRDGSSPADVLGLQSQLLAFDMESAGQYWQQLADAALKTQVEMMACASHVLDGPAGEALAAALARFQPTASSQH